LIEITPYVFIPLAPCEAQALTSCLDAVDPRSASRTVPACQRFRPNALLEQPNCTCSLGTALRSASGHDHIRPTRFGSLLARFGASSVLTIPPGPNGPLPKEILEMYPNSTLIKRQGEVDAWDNADFRAAVEATGKKQVIVAGITTDVCEFLAKSTLVFPHTANSLTNLSRHYIPCAVPAGRRLQRVCECRGVRDDHCADPRHRERPNARGRRANVLTLCHCL